MEPVYPKTPLEQPIELTGQVHELPEQQHLLHATPAPPSYDQATSIPAQTTGPGATEIPAVTTGPGTGTGHTVIIVPGTPYGPEPQDIQCPYCHNYARTRVMYKPNSRTHLIALLLCLFQ